MAHKDNILQELRELGSPLAGLEKGDSFFEVPAGYFDQLPGIMLERVRTRVGETVREELNALSPLLAGMEKRMPYEIPQGYFEEHRNIPEQGKVVRLGARRWMRYAAAAIMTGFLLTAGLLIRNNSDVEKMSLSRFEKKLGKEMDRMSEGELAEFLEYSDAGLTGQEKVSGPASVDVKALLKDIPVTELKEFIEETSVIATEVMLN